MKRAAFAILIIFLIFQPGPNPIRGQFSPEELARRESIENFLLTADIVNSEPIGEGVTKPTKIYLKKGDIEGKAVWKNPSRLAHGVLDDWRHEIAAYRVDKLVRLNLVPPTVQREFKGKPGSLQFWVETKYSLLYVMENGIPVPKSAMDRITNMNYLIRAFDSLIGNEDRTQQNVLYTEDWRTILIDHSRAFQSSKKFTKALMFGSHGIKLSAEGKPYLFKKLPRPFVESLRALTLERFKEAVGETLTEKEIQAVIARRDLLLKEIDEMIQKGGEENVIYE